MPLRLGLVTSIGSAAHADITTVLAASGKAFTLVEHHSEACGLDHARPFVITGDGDGVTQDE